LHAFDEPDLCTFGRLLDLLDAPSSPPLEPVLQSLPLSRPLTVHLTIQGRDLVPVRRELLAEGKLPGSVLIAVVELL
jgi:hypothetical protein